MVDRANRNSTIKDVAMLAGCGIASASRVLNRSGYVSPQLREKVLAAAQQLGFDFSDIGRSFRNQATKTIGCVVPSISNPVYSVAVQGIQDVVVGKGRHLLLSCSNYDPEREFLAVRNLIAKRVEALVLTVNDPKASAALDLVRSRQVPHCLLFNHDPGSPNACGVDNRAAAYEVVRAFANAGHRHFVYVALRLSSSDRASQRLEGLEAACNDLGLDMPAVLEIEDRPNRLKEDLETFLRANPEATGIFASNDQLAIAIIAALRELGLKVPADLSIVGFDGIEFGQMLEPTLATVVTDPYAMGRAAADMVLSMGHLADAHLDSRVAGFSFRSGGSLGPAATGKPLVEKLPLPHQHISPRKNVKLTSEERRK
ncbi:LacI family DNA-binding transcriptional regulator [Mesorhizobium sp. 8]|uniref:LacI family DNA-binding transcriptional regulator n=1 Tax=Mesorhizobium sp. 8 TaxID=2584466 RepID=UPI0011229C88|nr:LacI family DNA-binding transcriptional regulator [Mesorhizobium sp. 8]QDC02342.1 LacI family DNA-binding transcriptional regulator [Mesorhizobium sp. 8]